MNDIVHFEPITPEVYENYIEVGTRAYKQHYLHLWPNENSSPYIKRSFTRAVLEKEENDKNTILYRILIHTKAVGIFKLTLDRAMGEYEASEALCVDKIYILKEYSGKGIGKKVLQFAMLRAREMHKKIIWLDTMQQGRALDFYLKNGFEIYEKSKVTLPTIIEEKSLMWILIKKC